MVLDRRKQAGFAQARGKRIVRFLHGIRHQPVNRAVVTHHVQLAGLVESTFTGDPGLAGGEIDWAAVWLVPAGIAAIVLVLLGVFFRSNHRSRVAADNQHWRKGREWKSHCAY